MALSVKDNVKEKWCPMGATAFPRAKADEKCIGPDCMMWRTGAPRSGLSCDGDNSYIDANRNGRLDADDKGYCCLLGSHLTAEEKFFCGL